MRDRRRASWLLPGRRLVDQAVIIGESGRLPGGDDRAIWPLRLGKRDDAAALRFVRGIHALTSSLATGPERETGTARHRTLLRLW